MPAFEASPLVVTVAILAYLFGGVAKGVSGLGLQAICVPVLALVAPLETAIGLGILPAFATSLWQGLAGGALRKVLLRTWTFLLPCCLTIFLGASVLANVDRSLVAGTLGGLLCVYAAYAITRPSLLPSLGRHETWMSPVAGAVTGVAGGATGVFVMPGAPYYQLLQLNRDELVQALSFSAIVIMPFLALALGHNDLFSQGVQLSSIAVLVPTLIGLWLGTIVRRWIPEAEFRRLFFWLLLALGSVITVRNLLL
jgi:uncharacterized membrane protein YfcA